MPKGGIRLGRSVEEQEKDAPPSDAGSGTEDADEFPELEVGGSGSGEGDDDDDAADSESDDASGFNSDDVADWDDADDSVHHDTRTSLDEEEEREGEEALARMIARERRKPDESAPRTNRLGIDTTHAAALYGHARNADGSSRGQVVPSKMPGETKMEYAPIEPEYDSDSSTEETANRIGNVPLEWYDDLPHLGYDIDGKRVLRPAQGDELDRFLATVEGDGDAWFSARNKQSGQDVRLTDEELDVIQRLQRAEIPLDAYDPYEPASDWFTGAQHQQAMPLSGAPEPKRRFVPSKWEHNKVMKIVRAIRQGRILAHAPGKERPALYSIWSDADAARPDHAMHMPAPKLPLPSHVESYNPPEEYLFDDEEKAAWEAAEPEDRRLPFLPAKHASLRVVPRYEAALQERFQRCLDLYLAPRMRRRRIDVDNPDALLPQLPSPRELRPFPTNADVAYVHSARVRCASVDPTGAWLMTGADDGFARLWDLALGRCVRAWDMGTGLAAVDRSPVYSVQWCPVRQYAVAAFASAGRVTLIAPPVCSGAAPGAEYVSAAFARADDAADAVRWVRPSPKDREGGVCVRVMLSTARAGGSVALLPKSVRWHARGDYFATVCPDARGDGAVLIHQVSKHRSQAPFRRRRSGSSAMAVQCVAFHPSRPLLFVATQRYVRIFDLVAQALQKTLQPGVRWISSMDVHPSGEHLLVGSYDRRVLWFDLELSERPYKSLRYHTRAVRSVAFHPRFPLFAAASDDGTVHVYHNTVYADLLQNPLIVPLKVLRGHSVRDALGVLDAVWHPTLPWLVSAAADGDARLWTP
ncbi:Ribosome biogenesis protein erb1 [Malassezia sp. CBS 17886]|nr:Ribosome biogenesis protein erb1 [Malassezia sp. CBS 17886]